jgi:hypothetical protein
MSERTAQCEECTTVFPCNPTGRLPKLCPSCKDGDAERSSTPAKRRKKSSIPSPAPVDYEAVAESIRADIEQLESQIEVRRTALAAIEGLFAA